MNNTLRYSTSEKANYNPAMSDRISSKMGFRKKTMK
jgi:hypothetical protein